MPPSYAVFMAKGRASAAARAGIALLLLYLAVQGVAAQSAGTGQREPLSVEGRAAAIRKLGLRAEGSKPEADAFEYVEASLRGMGLSPAVGDFSDAFEDFSRSRIVEAVIRGTRNDELAVIVPVGSWIDSPDGTEGAFALALALDEAARLSAEKAAGMTLPITVRFVFLGAEKRGGSALGEMAALGSRTWIKRQEDRGLLAALYLDMPFTPARVELKGAGRGVLSPYWYFERMRRALGASGMEYEIEANRQEAYRLGLASDYGPSAPYLEANIPAIELRSARSASVGADPSWFHRFIGGFAAANAGGFSESWDRHYFVFQLGSRVAILREKSYVAIIVSLAAIVALTILAATVARRQTMKRLLKRGPVFALELVTLFGALVAVVFVGKELAELEAAVLGSSRAWTLLPRVFAVSRVLFSFLLFLSLLSFLVEKRLLTPNPYYYEFAGLVCLAIDVIVFSVVDLSAAFYFIWALVVVEASLAIRRKWTTVLAYVVMYFPLLVIAGELLREPDLIAYGKLIAPDSLGILTFAALSLPFFAFTASPLLFIAPAGTEARKKAALVLAVLALTAEASAIAWFKIAVPPSGPGRSDLRVSESIDQDFGTLSLKLEGKQGLGRGSLIRGGSELKYDEAGDEAQMRGEDLEKRIEVEETASPFLDRVDEELRIKFANPPYSLELKLESEKEMLIYDCSLPYKVAVDGKSATIYAGVNPGVGLSFTLTVPDSFRSKLTVKARYLSPLEACAQSSGSPLSFSGLILTASRQIGAGPRGFGGS
jgi:hypothetical protein